MPCSRIAVSVLAVIAVAANGQPGGLSARVDPAPEPERYVIEPGAEPLLADMLGKGGESLPGGCTLGDGQIERSFVVATYTCGGGQVVLQFSHPDAAPSAAVHTKRFAITLKSGTPPAGLVKAIADRIRSREAAFEWKNVRATTPRRRPWAAVAGGIGAAILVSWAIGRLVARRRRQE